MEHHTSSYIPAYVIWVHHRPSKHKGETPYKVAIRLAAQKQIASPIPSSDVEVEIIYSALTEPDHQLDVDNYIKPTLDALKGIAYIDDKQVRNVSSARFNRHEDNRIGGLVQHMGELFYSGEDVVLINIYADARVAELGGREKLENDRKRQWEIEFESKLNTIRKNK